MANLIGLAFGLIGALTLFVLYTTHNEHTAASLCLVSIQLMHIAFILNKDD